MQVSEEERLAANREESERSETSNTPLLVGIGIAAVLLIVVAVYIFLKPQQEAEPPVITSPEPVATTPAEVEPPPEVPVREPKEPEFTLPALDQSDSDFRKRMIELNPDIAPWLQTDELVRRGVSFTDGLTRGQLLTKLVSIPPPEGKFQVREENGRLYLAEDNFARYDYLSEIVDDIDPEKLTGLFDLYRPLLEKAYGELGFAADDLGGNIIIGLNQILDVPVIEEPIALEYESVYYTFADPQLEKLTPLQKQLLRMGPETTKIVQQKAEILKQYLLTAPPQSEETTEETP